MTKKIYILYHPGSYGSYVRWLIDFANDVGHRYRDITSDPLMEDGSSHNFERVSKSHPNGLNEILDTLEETTNEDCGYKIYRAIPVIDEVHGIDEVLINITKKGDQVRCIYISINDKHDRDLVFINQGLKIKEFLNLISTKWNEKVKRYDLDSPSFIHSPRWVQREILSMNYEPMITSLTGHPRSSYPRLLKVDLMDIINGDPVSLAQKLLSHCGMDMRKGIDHVIQDTHSKMLRSQTSFKVLQETYDAVEACLTNTDMQLCNQTLFSEAIIQNELRKNGKEIRCWQLNVFPSSTAELVKLLY